MLKREADSAIDKGKQERVELKGSLKAERQAVRVAMRRALEEEQENHRSKTEADMLRSKVVAEEQSAQHQASCNAK